MIAVPAELAIGLFAHERPAELVARAATSWQLGAGRVPAGVPVRFALRAGQIEAAWPGGRARGPRLRVAAPAPLTLRAAGAERRLALGSLELVADGAALVPVVRVAFERYVAGVLVREAEPDWPPAALEAQAMAIRSYSAARRGATGHAAFDFCDATHCQRWRGERDVPPGMLAAAAATRGRVLAFRGRPAEAVWHAACGGWRAAAADVFGRESPPYLLGGPDTWCAASPHAQRWRVSPRAAPVRDALRGAGLLAPHEPLRGLTVAAAGPGGHVRAVRIEGARDRIVAGGRFWAALGPALGWTGLRSPSFTIAARPDGWRFTGRGLGHGVGMCQAGAAARAAAGQDADTILAAYFPGTSRAAVVTSSPIGRSRE